MNKINSAIREIHIINDMAERDVWINRMHPLSKVIVTLLYIILVMSFDRQNWIGLSGMCLYPLIMMNTAGISLLWALSRLKYLITGVFLIAIFNSPAAMVTLMMKGVFAILASYLLIRTTTIEDICFALRMLHVPKILVTLVMLIYRYIIMMLQEADRITKAYTIRAPGQKGINYKVWGSLVGQMFLRSIDKAEIVYESMLLRGFKGEYMPERSFESKGKSIAFAVVTCASLILLRIYPVFIIAGNLAQSFYIPFTVSR